MRKPLEPAQGLLSELSTVPRGYPVRKDDEAVLLQLELPVRLGAAHIEALETICLNMN